MTLPQAPQGKVPTEGQLPERPSPEYVGYLLLGTLVRWRQDHGTGSGRTLAHLAQKVPGLTAPREESVREILGALEARKLIRSTNAEGAHLFEVTAEGLLWYAETATLFRSAFERFSKTTGSG